MVLPTSEEGRVLTQDDLEMSLYTYKALCRRVVDGDTVDLDFDLGLDSHRYERVRLYGIDAPETYGVKKDSEEYKAGAKTKQRLANLVTAREIWVETHKDKTGKYGRYLATIWVVIDDALVNVNELLVDEGLAEHKNY
jgi:micrococcal nuclease